MHKLYELIVPSWAESLFYLAVSLIMLIILNAGALWSTLLNTAGSDMATTQSIDGSLRGLVSSLTTLSDPQLVNGFVWGATAAMGMCVAVAIGGFLRSTRENAGDLHSRQGELSFVGSLIVRLSALVGAILAATFGILWLLPVLSFVFASRLTHLSDSWQYGPTALLAWIGVAGIGYVLAILCRLVALRIRVFTPTID